MNFCSVVMCDELATDGWCDKHRPQPPGPILAPAAPDLLAAGGPVIHPAHYNATKYEAWDVLDVWFEHDPLLWTAGKYLARAPYSAKQIADLEKAVNYIRRRINYLQAIESAKQVAQAESSDPDNPAAS